MELRNVSRLVDDLDKAVSMDDAHTGLYQYGGEGDGSWVIGTRNGYLRLGIEFLKAGITLFDPGSTKTLIDS